MQVLDVVQVKIKHLFEVSVVSEMCCLLKNQNSSTVKQNMEFISELDLADCEGDESVHVSRVDILRGVGYYYNFFLGKIIKNCESLVASSSLPAFVLKSILCPAMLSIISL